MGGGAGQVGWNTMVVLAQRRRRGNGGFDQFDPGILIREMGFW